MKPQNEHSPVSARARHFEDHFSRKPHGDVTPYRKEGCLYCGCAHKRQKAGGALRVQS